MILRPPFRKEFLLNPARFGGGGGGVSGNAWNPSDKYASLVLSNSDKNVSRSFGGFVDVSVRALNPVNSGEKRYFELEELAVGANGYMMIAIALSTASLSLYIGSGSNPNGGSLAISSGVVYSNRGAISSGLTPGVTVGTNAMCAIDGTTRQIWFGINGTWLGNPAAGTGEAFIMNDTTAIFPTATLQQDVQEFTAKFVAADQTYSAPSGFSSW